ncbi:hypothetical protein B0H13DRAFT_1890289 [Mycena leptocephala]|nr:hypothetical protein B0H13DRAFT_1890289 [Mycena leptocephala]
MANTWSDTKYYGEPHVNHMVKLGSPTKRAWGKCRFAHPLNGDETKVGYYVGTMAMTVPHWSSLFDRIGSKPVILLGLMGLSVSMYCFGLSREVWYSKHSSTGNGGGTCRALALAYDPPCDRGCIQFRHPSHAGAG